MAFWNAPLDQKDHHARAALAAIKCQEVMEHLNKTHKFPFELPEKPEARIGLNSGPMKVGFTGSKQKLQYTVIGDEVNLGSRLEGANKFFGSKIMASEATYIGAKDAVEARELGRVRVVGKAVPIRVYELLAAKGKLSDDWKKALPLYESGLEHYKKRDFGQAITAFQEVSKILPEDGPTDFYLNAAKDFSAIPPDQDWDGVINLTAK
jgi:adenylate cyclase